MKDQNNNHLYEDTYFIAEMSGNHNQSFEKAIEIANSAKKIGANALKLQTYTADTLTIDCKDDDFLISDDSIWKGYNLYDLYKKAYTDWDWIKKIYEFCKSLELDCFSSVFDKSSIDFWEKMNPIAYKIASFENIHYPLIKYASETGRPLIISTGLASESEIDEMVSIARKNGCKDLTLLKCTSDYPSKAEDANLSTIPYLREKYNCRVGLSDHSIGNEIALASIALGATIIEKHFIISRYDDGVDSKFSSDENEFKLLINRAKEVKKSIGKPYFGQSNSEKKSLRFRRSIYVTKNIKKGEKFTTENIGIIRPGFGLHPKYYQDILNLESKKSYKKGSRLNKNDLN